ncbi:MAG: hypothetical protein ACK58Q_04150 [Chitinophagales bacterium]
MTEKKNLIQNQKFKKAEKRTDFFVTYSFPFGMPMPNRTYSLSSGSKYRFGFGGHENDDEILGDGNHLSFADFGYDPRIGRRWNVDPLASKYPMMSPYSTFNNNPILYDDPSGMSGEASINKQTKTITVTSIYAFYGSASTPKLAKEYAGNIEKAFNAANAKIKIDGVDYKVQFKVVGVDVSKIGGNLNEKVVQKHISQNTDIKINYVRLEESTNRSEGNSYTDPGVGGANTGYWSTKQVADNGGTTEPHEHNHSAGGLNHPETYDPDGGENSQNNTIDKTSRSYRYVKKEQMSVGKDGYFQVRLNKRYVSKENIEAIFENSNVVNQLKKTGKARVGNFTNEYHKK